MSGQRWSILSNALLRNRGLGVLTVPELPINRRLD